MADNTLIHDSTASNEPPQYRAPDQVVLSETSEESSEAHDTYRSFNYGYRSSNRSDDESAADDEDDEEDPYQELFMNAYRSAPQSSDEEETGTDANNCTNPAAKPLCLMEDWDLWDYLDETELKVRLKDHPRLLEEITRKRKRRLLEEEEAATAREDDELCLVMNRAVKCIRTEPSKLTS
ncbi:uncharacterized protein LOC126560424 [Anopheles maculipalpis]|uniref:uncharacterized protein LOC126560424 n=1 Tax=Anopheles maculipalpis TaxID=1496333 RepID=UPI002158B907|nr:uncharacterized protein LOC126560424 [Anopheles maculipalpis]